MKKACEELKAKKALEPKPKGISEILEERTVVTHGDVAMGTLSAKALDLEHGPLSWAYAQKYTTNDILGYC